MSEDVQNGGSMPPEMRLRLDLEIMNHMLAGEFKRKTLVEWSRDIAKEIGWPRPIASSTMTTAVQRVLKARPDLGDRADHKPDNVQRVTAAQVRAEVDELRAELRELQRELHSVVTRIAPKTWSA